jgi:hypothetical protein
MSAPEAVQRETQRAYCAAASGFHQSVPAWAPRAERVG